MEDMQENQRWVWYFVWSMWYFAYRYATYAHPRCIKLLGVLHTDYTRLRHSQHLRSATRHHLTVQRYRLSTFGRRAFSVAGPTVWNSLLDRLRDPTLSSNSFRQSLKTNLFRCYHSPHTHLSWAWWDWPLTWSTNCLWVLWHCWLGHLTRKVIPEMTSNVSSGTLNPTTAVECCSVV